MTHPLAWSNENELTLERLFYEGYSIKQMGTVLDMTKNKICGKLHRMKLRGAPNPIPKSIEFQKIITNLQLPPRDWSPQ